MLVLSSSFNQEAQIGLEKICQLEGKRQSNDRRYLSPPLCAAVTRKVKCDRWHLGLGVAPISKGGGSPATGSGAQGLWRQHNPEKEPTQGPQAEVARPLLEKVPKYVGAQLTHLSGEQDTLTIYPAWERSTVLGRNSWDNEIVQSGRWPCVEHGRGRRVVELLLYYKYLVIVRIYYWYRSLVLKVTALNLFPP